MTPEQWQRQNATVSRLETATVEVEARSRRYPISSEFIDHMKGQQ